MNLPKRPSVGRATEINQGGRTYSHSNGEVILRESDHYAIRQIKTVKELYACFHKDKKGRPSGDKMNWLVCSTGGVHGDWTTLDELSQGVLSQDKAYLTVLVIQPRLVKLAYGDIEVTRSDIPKLRHLIKTSLAAIRKSQEGNI